MFLTYFCSEYKLTHEGISAKGIIALAEDPINLNALGDNATPIVLPLTREFEFLIPVQLFSLLFPESKILDDITMNNIVDIMVRLFQKLPFSIIHPNAIPLEDVPPVIRDEYKKRKETEQQKDYMLWLKSGLIPPPNLQGGL